MKRMNTDEMRGLEEVARGYWKGWEVGIEWRLAGTGAGGVEGDAGDLASVDANCGEGAVGADAVD